MQPDNGDSLSYAQLYIFDAQLALEQRMERNDNLSKDTMRSFQTMLLQNNPYADWFKHAYEVLDQYPDNSDADIQLCVMPGQNRRHYNLPMSDEVAVILPDDGTAP